MAKKFYLRAIWLRLVDREKNYLRINNFLWVQQILEVLKTKKFFSKRTLNAKKKKLKAQPGSAIVMEHWVLSYLGWKLIECWPPLAVA